LVNAYSAAPTRLPRFAPKGVPVPSEQPDLLPTASWQGSTCRRCPTGIAMMQYLAATGCYRSNGKRLPNVSSSIQSRGPIRRHAVPDCWQDAIGVLLGGPSVDPPCWLAVPVFADARVRSLLPPVADEDPDRSCWTGCSHDAPRDSQTRVLTRRS
jgi:hypothetical protein